MPKATSAMVVMVKSGSLDVGLNQYQTANPASAKNPAVFNRCACSGAGVMRCVVLGLVCNRNDCFYRLTWAVGGNDLS